MTESEPSPFEVGRLPRVRGQIKLLLDRASQLEFYGETVEALIRVDNKLRNSPTEWGDPLYNTKSSGGVVCHAMEAPVNVHFVVFVEQRKVCILDIDPLAGHPLAAGVEGCDMKDNTNPNLTAFPLADAGAKTQEQWRSFCAALLLEIERLRCENDELREQRRALAQMVPIPKDVQELAGKSFEALMATCEGQFSLGELINEIKHGQGS